MIIHHVISSRPLRKKQEHFTYVRSLISGKNNGDAANDFLSFGRYLIENDIDPPRFERNGDSSEAGHFYHHPVGFQFPGEESIPFFTELFSQLKKEPDKLLYIYLFGFGNSVNSEMNKQLRPLHRHYYRNSEWGSPVGQILLLSWPSQGKLEYKHGEKDDVAKMGKMLAALFLKLYHFVNDNNNPLFHDWKPRIVLHTQSMGCFILDTLCRELAELEKSRSIPNAMLDKFFHRIIMTGADLPEDAFNDNENEPEYGIPSLAKRVILFHNEKDRALWISRVIFRSGNRLGGDAAPHPNDLPRNVDLVSLRNSSGSLSGHDYFQKKESVIKRLFTALEDQHIDGSPLNPDRNLFAEFDVDNDIFTKKLWSV